MSENRFCHRVYGLTVASEIELGDLAPAPLTDVHDVLVRQGRVNPAMMPENSIAFEIPTVARYLVSGGSEIIVDGNPSAEPQNIALYIVGSAMGILLHQRQILALHAASIDLDGGTMIAFTGRSGAGKSTLAAWFRNLGHGVAADDVCAIRSERSGARILGPGPTRMRLWRDAVLARGLEISTLKRSFVGTSPFDKFDVPLNSHSAAPANQMLRAIYSLEWGPACLIERVTGVEAFNILFANTYRGQFIEQVNQSGWHWAECANIARQVPIFRFTRPKDQTSMDQDNHRLALHLTSHAGGGK